MSILLKGAKVYTDSSFIDADIIIDDGSIVSVGEAVSSFAGEIIDCSGKFIFPGFIDVHVHFRDPGFS